MSSHKKIAWQKGNYGTFAEIEIELLKESDQDETTGVVVGIDLVDDRWQSGVQLASALLREKIPRTTTRFAIKVFRGQPGDTTVMAVAYVTFHAVAQQTAPELLRDFFFDEEKGEYVIASPQIAP